MSFRIAVLMISYSLAFGAGDGNFTLNNGESAVTTLSADINRTVMSLSISKLDCSESVVNGNESYSISLPDQFGMSRGAFLSDHDVLLPTVTRMIAVPFDSEPRLTVSGSNFTELPDIILSPADEEDLASYHIDDPLAAARTANLQNNIVTGEIAGIMRDVRIYAITFSPVQYDADNSVLRVYDRIEIEIEHSGSQLTMYEEGISEAFLPIYRSTLDNILIFDPIEITRGAYWFIYPDLFYDHIQPMADWKKAKGYDIEFIPKSEIGSNPSYITIKNYISARFDSCVVKPDYINIVADVSMPSGYGIATRTYNNPFGFGDIESDNYYTFLSGGDYFPEIMIGRISIDYVSDLESYTNKLFTYERTPYMGDTGWYLRGTMVAGGTSGSFESPMLTNLWCRDRMLDAGYTSVDTIFEYYWGQVQPYVINNSINGGVSYVNYRGWGMSSGWYSPDYGVSNLYQLSNGPRYPVMTSIVCGTGDYNDGVDVCFGEAWIRYSNKGGAGFIGTSNHDSHTRFNNAIDVGVYWAYFVEDVYTITQAQLLGKMTLYYAFPGDTYPRGRAESYFNSYNVLGDPELNCWTQIPEDMTVTYNESQEFGQNHINVIVTNSSGEALEGAYVCLWKEGELFTGDFADERGSVDLPVHPESIGDMAVTVTARNFIPHEGTVSFVSNEVTLGYSAHIVDDDDLGESSGNGDGACSPSEIIELDITLENFGQSETAIGVTAEISCESPYVDITRNTADYPDLAPGENGSADSPYLIEFSPDALNGSLFDLMIAISDGNGHSWQSMIQVPVEAAEFRATEITVVDSNNGVIDPGETVEMFMELENTGTQAITGAQAILRCADDQVTIIDSTAIFGYCEPGGVFDNSGDMFLLSVDSDVYVGHIINFTLDVNGDGPMNVTAAFGEQVGIISSDDPIGPDNYGYYCFDNTDVAYSDHPIFDWVDIDTQNWDYVSLSDDDVETISLPFQVFYYGQPYTEITICDNGFVALGESWWNAWYNTTIPAPQNAGAMIAPLWTDFKQYGLRIYYHHDTDNSRFIIGWNNVMSDTLHARQTMEIIFLDRLAWPSLTGDNEIILQYYDVNNPVWTSVGICSPDRRDGICYLFNNDYADGAAELEDSRAIKFTTGSMYQTDTDDPEIPVGFWLSQNYPNPFNASTQIEFSISESGTVSLEVFNILGQKVEILADGHFEAGNFRVIWDAVDMPSGIYFFKLSSSGLSEKIRTTLLK